MSCGGRSACLGAAQVAVMSRDYEKLTVSLMRTMADTKGAVGAEATSRAREDDVLVTSIASSMSKLQASILENFGGE